MRSYFTPEQVEELIPIVRKKIRRLQRLQQAVALIEDFEIEAEDEELEYHYNFQLEKEFHRLNYQFYCQLESIEKLGAIVKDIEWGVVDFPCQFQGREILLCWQLGEPQLQFWHELEDGYENRQPIVNLNKH